MIHRREATSLTALSTSIPSCGVSGARSRAHDLFKTTDSVYPIRCFDISVMSINKTNRGYVVVDLLVSIAFVRAGKARGVSWVTY